MVKDSVSPLRLTVGIPLGLVSCLNVNRLKSRLMILEYGSMIRFSRWMASSLCRNRDFSLGNARGERTDVVSRRHVFGSAKETESGLNAGRGDFRAR